MTHLAAHSRLICFSHLRWNFVFQRPQHLMTRASATYDVVYFEEPVFREAANTALLERSESSGLRVLTPVLPTGHPEPAQAQRRLLDRWLADQQPMRLVTWYYTPMALEFSRHLSPDACVFDCMDELSAFVGAPPAIVRLEADLFEAADLVFTGGRSLYQAKRERHPSVHLFPSSVDREHFAKARVPLPEPDDQSSIPGPRVGFFGVIDERMDTELVAFAAASLPEIQFVMIGPVVKIDPRSLPDLPNLHWLGQKSYCDLPGYLGHWDAGWMPFALNESTRFISPTKTPEFLAAGLQVVSTAVPDVVTDYGEAELVSIADQTNVVEGLRDLTRGRPSQGWMDRVDRHLSALSWDETWVRMDNLIAQVPPALSIKPPALPSSTGLASEEYDWLVVGAGFAGSVLAERLASVRDERVLVIDKRPHIGGNAHDHLNDAGILVHKYGPHIFHTNAPAIVDYLSQFTEWRDYEHRVRANVDGKMLPIPINLDTVNRLYGLDLDSRGMEDFLQARRERPSEIATSEDAVVAAVGRELYEKFFKGYTRKQWGVDPSQLSASVAARIPTRTDREDRYFTDRFQLMPADGYTTMFGKMLDRPNIDLALGRDFRDLQNVSYKRLIYTGRIDEFFDYRLGKLPYRCLAFEHITMPVPWVQPVAVINYPQTEDYTRLTEYKHLTGQRHPWTSLTYEYPCDEGDPYYPVPRPENERLYKEYEELAKLQKAVWFVGRLATYRYYNMDQVVGQALATFRRIDLQLGRETREYDRMTASAAAS